MRKKKEYLYEIEYASGLLRPRGRQDTYIVSNKKLKEKQFIVVEHIGCGVFIGRVVKEIDINALYDRDGLEYIYLQDIDLSSWVDEIERKKRREELEEEMEFKFEELDKKKRFEYYAQIDEEFSKLYSEYKNL